ncbi:MAG: hypothetical protein JWM14_2789 [Chitinophagaceae bacterium]|nr:hypothetical protein [Chitinophagaceae bacterium]
MKGSVYQLKKKEEQIDKAVALYIQGFSARQVSKALAQMGIIMSYSTVARVVRKKLSTSR